MGRITIDDIVDVITELAEEERQMMAGISEDVEEDDSVWMLTRARLPWLIIGMFGGLLGAQFIGVFEKDILLVPAMAFFIPLITATGGNVGIQSSSIVLQSLASKSVFDNSFMKRITKVILVALLNGLVIAGIVMGMNLILGQDLTLALVVSIALFGVVLIASLMGTITPLILDRFGINPAIASGPFITTANDLLGLLVYFSVAHLLYSNL
jgi:magnesium transporter